MNVVCSSRFLLMPVIVACALTSWSRAQESRTVEEHFSLAQHDQRQGLLDEAVREYLTVLKLKPRLPEAHVNLGLVYYAQAKFEDSARELTTASKLRPGMRGVSLWLGIDYVKLNRPAQGSTLLREAIRLDPADKVAQTWLGTSLWDAGQMDVALSQFRSANARFPEDPDLIFALSEAYDKAASQQTEQLLEESAGTAFSDLIYGTIYSEERAWSKSESHLRRAIERDPRSLDARLNLAQVYLEQDHLSAAQELLDQSTSLAPRSAAALARSGELLLLSQRFSEGLALVKRAMEIDPSGSLDALGLPIEDDREWGDRVDGVLLSQCHAAAASLADYPDFGPNKDIALAALNALAGDEDAARRSYLNAGPLPLTPPPSPDDFARATVALHQHLYGDAEEPLLRWLRTHPSDRMARYDLVLARRQISRSQLRHLLQVAPDSYHVHQMLGQLYAGRDDDDRALDEYLAVAAARPDLPGVHFWLGHLYWKHGDADHAFAELTRELELSPGHPESNGELGAVLVAEDRTEEAIPHLEAAIRSKPDLWPAYAQLGHAYASEKEYARAEEVLNRALAHDHDGATHYRLALVLRAEGKTAQAARVFEEVRAIKNENLAAPSANDSANGGEKQ
jgi:tetratricopeptide (TPR) repeat protein